jgi:hypothetical protein
MGGMFQHLKDFLMSTLKASNMKRGAIPSPRHKLAAATPHKIVGTTPPNCIYIPPQLSFWGNDVYGDCVTAEEAFAKACYGPEIFIPSAEVISWATANGFLNGAVLVSVLEVMENSGFEQNNNSYDDGYHTAVDWTNAATLQNAISQGPVKIGVAAANFEAVTPGTNGWFLTDLPLNSNEDHCVSLCGYGTMSWLAQQFNVSVPSNVNGDDPGYAMFTWNSIGIIDVPSLLNITAEAWLRNPTTDICPIPPVNAIESSSGNFFTVVNNGGLANQNAAIQTYMTTVTNFEKFKICNISTSQSPGAPFTFALQTFNGNYVTAVNGGGMGGPNDSSSPIHTDQTAIGGWETLTFEPQSDGTYAILTSSGYYLTATNGGGVGEAANLFPIHTDATAIGPWETLTLSPI